MLEVNPKNRFSYYKLAITSNSLSNKKSKESFKLKLKSLKMKTKLVGMNEIHAKKKIRIRK